MAAVSATNRGRSAFLPPLISRAILLSGSVMKDAAEKSVGEPSESLRETYVEECSRLRIELADTCAKLQRVERDREISQDELAIAKRQIAEICRSPLYRLCKKLEAADRRQIFRRVFDLVLDVKRAKVRYGRALSRMGARLEYVPIFFARSIPTQGQVFFSELVPASDLPRRLVRLRSREVSYSYTFTCGFDGLSQISIALDTSKVTTTLPLCIRVELAGAVLHEETRDIHADPRALLSTLSFAPISRSANKQCTVTVSSPKGTVKEYISIVLVGDRRETLPRMTVNSEVALAPASVGGAFNLCFVAEVDSPSQRRSLGWGAAGATVHYAALYGDRVASFSFQCPIQPLSGIYVFFNPGDRSSYAEIRLVVERDGRRLWSGVFSARLIKSGERFLLPIPQVVLDELTGGHARISLSSPKAASDQFVFVLGTPNANLSGSEFVDCSAGVNFDRTIRLPVDGAMGAPIFKTAFRRQNSPLRVSILEGAPSQREARHVEILRIFSELRALGHDVSIHSQADLKALLPTLRDSDVVVIPDQDYSDALREVVTEVRLSYGIVVGLPMSAPAMSELMAACTSMLPVRHLDEDFESWLNGIVRDHRDTADLSVSIVTVLYRKEREIPLFLRCLARQDFNGESELVVVNDCSPDKSKETLIKCYEELRQQGYSLPTLKIIDNDVNSGNCASRNAGLKVATGDVVVILDADCLLNENFLSAHVHSHIFHEASVVIGPCNLESGLADPVAKLKEYEKDPKRVQGEAELQDPINLNSFVNCITRNFSIRRTAISDDLFDEVFGYSASPESGFGWEDVEMGYRLFKRGLKIHFTSQAISVHVTHPSSTEDKVKPLKSLKNFRRLIEKHPTIASDARRWFQDTFAKIEQWSAACGHSIQDDQRIIREKLGDLYPYPFAIKKNRELRIVTYRWHVPHQYELYKLPHQFNLLRGLGTGFTQDWMYEQRPMPKNARFLPVEKFDAREADLAILHFDENVLQPENCNGVISKDWGDNFRYFMREIKGIPKVAVCHGTPQFFGQYNPTYSGDDLGVAIESSREALVRYLGEVPVVCNSHQALREWGFKNARVIWQGFDPSEFYTTNYEGGVLTLGRAIKERPYYRGYKHYLRVCELLPQEYQPEYHTVPRPPLGISNSDRYARLKYEVYKDSLRQYSVYLNPTIRSPMPRSRGEAMMCGLVTVSATNHDVEMFIKNGWNGFYAETAEEMAEQIRFLMKNKNECRKIGERSRTTAADIFNHDRYLDAWQTLISEVVRS